MSTTLSIPYAPGTVSLGLHPMSQLPAPEIVRVLVQQGRLAEQAGFDGVTVSEHHVGLSGYLPLPAMASSWILAETQRIWSGPAPTLLTMRNPGLLAEELAWTAARYPGRFGAAFAAGYNIEDFKAIGMNNENLSQRFAAGLEELSAALSPDGPLKGDQAVEFWNTARPILLAAANSSAAATRAANAGMGMLLIGSDDVAGRSRRVVDAYEEAGGASTVMWIRRAFIGDPPAAAMAELEKAYGAWDKSKKGGVNDFVTGTSEDVAEQLAAELAVLGGSSALNVRVYLPGVSEEETAEQVARFGAEVLPLLRAAR